MIQFVHVEEKYIPQMAAILAERHATERLRFPFLPEQFESVEETMKVLQQEINKPFSGGLVTLRGEEVIGYLLYEFKEEPARGRYVSVGYPSFAIKKGELPRLVRLMYAEAGAEWIRNGYFEHVLFAPIGNDPIILELLEQSYRFDQRYAVLPLDLYTEKSKVTANVTCKQVANDEIPLLQEMAHWNAKHEATAPSWSPITVEALYEAREQFSELAQDTEVKMWIAEQNGVSAAFHVYYPAEASQSLITPENTAHLAAASTNIELRGKGIGTSIADYCFLAMKDYGFKYIMVDWHTPNHISSYFWPKLGFQSYMIRMIRSVDPRIAWANGGPLQ